MMHCSNFFMIQKLIAFKAGSLNCDFWSQILKQMMASYFDPHLSVDEQWALLKLANQYLFRHTSWDDFFSVSSNLMLQYINMLS